MTEDNTKLSELGHILSKLRSAQRGVMRVGGMRTVEQNLQYLVEDIEQAMSSLEHQLNTTKETK